MMTATTHQWRFHRPLPAAVRDWLVARFSSRVKFREPMSRHTSLRVGGPAQAFVRAADVDEIRALQQTAASENLSFTIVGGGTNLLVGDDGIAGIVVTLMPHYRSIRMGDQAGGTAVVTVLAGATTHALCRFAIRQGLAGMNFALGIPGTVGGAVVMNAGTAGGCMHDVVTQLTVMTAEGVIRTYPAAELKFEYRRLSLPGLGGAAPGGGATILEACFQLTAADRRQLQHQAGVLLSERRRRQPTRRPSAGCFFKNPDVGPAAGQLIDGAGLKGKRLGGACVSTVHGNFIVNAGGASAEDILHLMRMVQNVVADKYHVNLIPEVVIIGAPGHGQ